MSLTSRSSGLSKLSTKAPSGFLSKAKFTSLLCSATLPVFMDKVFWYASLSHVGKEF